VTTDV